MSQDISAILRQWEYEGEETNVRVIQGDDGREKIQLRVDLGLLQMEMHGRPDGRRPEGRESWLDFYRERQESREAEPGAADFHLSDEEALRLWREGVQYYHRYLAFWHLKLYDLCSRDTLRNIRLFDFVAAHCTNERVIGQFEQFRPYVYMMHARAVATPRVERGQFAEALAAIDEAIESIGEFLDAHDRGDQADQCAELVNLQKWREEVVAQADRSPQGAPVVRLEVLRRRLQEAVSLEQFEEAARLRDEIRTLSESQPT